MPYAFTEQGVAMLSSVLRSPQAVQVNIAIMRAFVQFREVLAGRKDLVDRLAAFDRRLGSHDGQINQHAAEIRAVFQLIRKLMTTPRTRRTPIGFNP